jgi:hypothetical protein
MALEKKINDTIVDLQRDRELFDFYMDHKKTLEAELQNEMPYKDRFPREEYLRWLDTKLEAIAGGEEIDFLLDIMPLIQKYDSTETTESVSNPQKNGGILGFVKIQGKQNRGTVSKEFEDYLESGGGRFWNVAKQDVPESEKELPSTMRMAFVCPDCDVPYVTVDTEASSVCPQCGMTTWAWEIYSNNLTYNEQLNMEYSSYYAYKRINHFSEWLASVQAKENTKIPDEVLDALRVEYRKIRVSRASQITPSKTKEFLKKLKLTKYYEHVHYITNLLNGITPMWIPPALEEKMKNMFQEIQTPWQKTKPKNRSNFFSYSYVLHKFCELLGADEYLPLFPLLKSAEKLYQQDLMWKSVCSELGWEFRNSV